MNNPIPQSDEDELLDKQLREILGDEDWKYTEKPYRLMHLIASHDKALLERLEAERPKESTLEHHVKPIRYMGVPELSEYDLGRNQAITDQAAVIKRIREEL